MDFDSPEVMKDFPGLYSAEKRKGNDIDYNDENEKATKKDMIIGKRKEKKDKKDKDKGYAALEGESSDEASPCKAKKSKAFKFSKSKDKEKDKDKEKEHVKDKGENRPKKKAKHQKFPRGFGYKLNPDGASSQAIADALPIFGVDLEAACRRGKCHDEIFIPLPVRECIDYIEAHGLNFENIYKISGPKNKVHQIKKLYNNRQPVKFTNYEIPTATSVLKAFLRDLPESIFTNELTVRFEEAGAILNYNTRGKHLKLLINALPPVNHNLVTWLIVHLDNVAQREQINKMNKQNLAQALSHSLHISSRLLQALISHRDDLFPKMKLVKYFPPLEAGSAYPEDPEVIMEELHKLESALSLIHWEMQQGFFSDGRQDQLWEVQRVQTDLKRKLKKAQSQRHQVVVSEEAEESEGVLPAAVEEAPVEYYEVDEEIAYRLPPNKDIISHDPTTTPQYSDVCSDVGEEESESLQATHIQNHAVAGPGMEAEAGAERQEKVINTDSESDEDQDSPGNQQVLMVSGQPGYLELNKPGYQRMSDDKSPGNPLETGAEIQVITDRCRVDPGTNAATYQRILSNSGYCEEKFVVSGTRSQHNSAGTRHQEVPAIVTRNQPFVVTAHKQEFTEEHAKTLDQIDAYCTNRRHEIVEKISNEEDPTSLNDLMHKERVFFDEKLVWIQTKNRILLRLVDGLTASIKEEKQETEELKKTIDAGVKSKKTKTRKVPRHFEQLKRLLISENHMLQIKKIQLVRQIMDIREQSVHLKAKIKLLERQRQADE